MPGDNATLGEPIISLGPFGGLDTSAAQVFVPPPLGTVVSNLNLGSTSRAFEPARGRIVVGTPPNPYLGQPPLYALAEVYNTYVPEYELIGFNSPIGNPTGGQLQYCSTTSGGTAWTLIPTTTITVITPTGVQTFGIQNFGNANDGSIVTFNSFAWFCNEDPNGLAWKINLGFLLSVSQSLWGIFPGVSGPFQNVGAAATGGALTPGTTYTYAYTYINGSGWESSLNYPVATFTTGAANGNLPVGPYTAVVAPFPAANSWIAISIPISQDPQVQSINVYRLSPSLPTFTQIATIPNTSLAISYVGGTSAYTGGGVAGQSLLVDGLADTAVAGAQTTPRRDPPAPFYSTVAFKGSIFGFGHDAFRWYSGNSNSTTSFYFDVQPGPCDLWWTNYNEPWAFNNVVQIQTIDSDTTNDTGVGLGLASGVLVCLKALSTWLFYYNGSNDYQLPQELGSMLGCTSKRSIVSVAGIVFWLSNQGIMMFDGTKLENLSTKPGASNIKTFIDNYSGNLASVSAAFYDDTYWITFPGTTSASDFTFGYHLPTQRWGSVPYGSNIMAFDTENITYRPNALSALFADSRQSAALGVGSVEQWFYGYSDVAYPGGTSTSPIITTFTSGIWMAQRPEWWRATYLYIAGQNLGGTSATFTYTVTANPGATSQQVWSNPVTFGRNPFVFIHIPPAIAGSMFQVSLLGSTQAVYEVERIQLYGIKLRDITPADSI